MTRRLSLILAVIFTLVGLTAKCGAARDPGLLVLGASSLTESLQRAGAAWTAHGNPNVQFSFDASSRLAKQVEAGVPADVFLSADQEWMDYLAIRGLIDASTRLELLGNSLVAVIGSNSTLALQSAVDLGKPEIRRLALGGENVPVGRYARAALTHVGVWQSAQGRVVNGENVRTVLGWVANGDADAGVVYATDARVDPRVKVAFTFPAATHPAIVYPGAVLKSSTRAADAAAFLAFCRSAEGRAIFEAAGFSAAPG